MCFASSKDPPPIEKPASIADPNIQAAGQDAQKRARAAAGSQSTILSTIFNAPQTMGKQLLGQ